VGVKGGVGRSYAVTNLTTNMNTSPTRSDLNHDYLPRGGKLTRRIHLLSSPQLYSYETYLHDYDCWHSRLEELCFKRCALDEALRFMLVLGNAGLINKEACALSVWNAPVVKSLRMSPGQLLHELY
jgi:hypothetical protein